MYPSGLESFGIVMRETLAAFKFEYQSVLTVLKIMESIASQRLLPMKMVKRQNFMIFR